MRVISGALRGKRLKSFKGRQIRPTSDKVKESLFNIIGASVCEGTFVLDLFAGAGSLGIEALSRGALGACFVEKNKTALKLVSDNLNICALSEKADILPIDVFKALPILEKKNRRFDLIFLDPPYNIDLADKTLSILGASALSDGALVVAEEAVDVRLKPNYGRLEQTDYREYGSAALTFYRSEER